ncbi:GNAT family N-acetyltransferase [Flavobacterium sp. NST-5]|uniref:GNAT family N-acetyltransferase n=1 Tax=Flavobacterium ichthyis TaxID=2698827 RepID=A0ABW9Z5S3_9FLAO|nr:peptidogalycan biosysnthesis protein [Flavobacterium ichthyis]NBL63596.1 GNAT family N-acetyltransferase [Flavobacterium ichthyis]
MEITKYQCNYRVQHFTPTFKSHVSNYSFQIFTNPDFLPKEWELLANHNIFLSQSYFKILKSSAPENMQVFFIGIFKNENLCGIGIAQFLNLNLLESFGERDRCFKTSIRNFIFKTFSSHVLFMGNNMLTGENSYFFTEKITFNEGFKILKEAAETIRLKLKKEGIKIHLVSYKDFYPETAKAFDSKIFNKFYKFSTQPNMTFNVRKNWKSFDDYILDLSKKYRDQYKRARKKSEKITKKKLVLEDILQQEENIYELYFHVAKNAPFNTFFLAKNHFSELKKIFGENFLLYGYFLEGKLVGFSTLIKNNEIMETYFLGYDVGVQKNKMLYLNMLYDMIAYSINNNFKKIIFGRTALEIKSSVGAEAVEMQGFISHQNSLINKKINKIFSTLEPKTVWQARSLFKS